jgi:ribosome-associated protein
VAQQRDAEIAGEEIRLGQLLKLIGMTASGGRVKQLLTEREVRVNGVIETRRGRRLRDGDVVEVDGTATRVSARGTR